MANRSLTAALLAALGAGTVRPVWFFEGQFEAAGSPQLEYLRLWSGIAPISWDSKTWTAAGNLIDVGPVGEASDVRAVGFSVSLAGDASAILALNLGFARQGLPGRVWLGALDAAGALVLDPFKVFEGRFDVPEILDEGERCTIAARYESRLIDLDRPRMRRYTDEDQQAEYPGDLGFQYVTSLQNLEITWGRG